MLVRVGVLIGGMSVEREVSFNSGRTICDHLDTSRYSIIPIFQHSDGTLFYYLGILCTVEKLLILSID